jgi:hypothetical protein
MVGITNNLLIEQSGFGLNSEIAMYSAESQVLSECQTEPGNSRITSNSFNVESVFGTTPAPFDISEAEKILSEEVIVETPYLNPSDVEALFGAYGTIDKYYYPPIDIDTRAWDDEIEIENYMTELEKTVGKPYVLGGGQNGNNRGFDCCGGVMNSIQQATGININVPGGLNVPGLFNEPWLEVISREDLRKGDLIFCAYGNSPHPMDHVMTCSNSKIDNEGKRQYFVITTNGTEGRGGRTVKDQDIAQWDEYVRGSSTPNKTGQMYYRRINWERLRSMYQPQTRR